MLDMAFELEGYCVVRGPDCLWGGDVRKFHPPSRKFDGVIGGPPCQTFSQLAYLVRAGGREPKFGNLIPEFERCVREAAPEWFLMENVPRAPVPQIAGYRATDFLLDNSYLSDGTGYGLEQRRVRRFTFGWTRDCKPPSLLRWIDLCTFLLPDAATVAQWGPEANRQAPRRKQRHKAVSGSNGGAGSQRNTPGAGNDGKGRYRLADAIRLQGLPAGFLDDAPFTAEGKLKAVANGVAIPTGRAVARAIRESLQ